METITRIKNKIKRVFSRVYIDLEKIQKLKKEGLGVYF